MGLTVESLFSLVVQTWQGNLSFLISVWANDPEFQELNEKDPFAGSIDGGFEMVIPKRPIKKKLKGINAFTTVTGGAYFFLPGIRALKYLASLK